MKNLGYIYQQIKYKYFYPEKRVVWGTDNSNKQQQQKPQSTRLTVTTTKTTMTLKVALKMTRPTSSTTTKPITTITQDRNNSVVNESKQEGQYQ